MTGLHSVTTIIDMDVSWDENKNRQNVKKHLLDFADASEVLDAPHFVYEDNRNDYGEQRFIAVGHLRGRLVVIVYTMRQNINLTAILRTPLSVNYPTNSTSLGTL